MAAAIDVFPRFFKVFVSQFSSKSILIPNSYYEHLPRRLPKTAILMGTSGRFWKVAMMKKNDQIYFDQGWDKFVEDNDLKDGEFLTFVFDGHRTYEVSIYGHGTCKETRASIVQVEEISNETESDNDLDITDITTFIQVEEISDESESDYSLDNSEISSEEESDSDYYPHSLNIEAISKEAKLTNTTMNIRTRNKKSIENPEAYLDDPNNLYFVTSLKNRPYELIVSKSLVKDYDLKFNNSIEYIDDYGELTAKLGTWRDQRICIKKWKSICNRNKVTKHDSILCELLRDNNNNNKVIYAIKIHIIRGETATENT